MGWHWLEEVRPHEKQGWQDRQQKEECSHEGQPVARSSQSRSRSSEDQGLRCHQEGVSPVQQGQGALQEVSLTHVVCPHSQSSGLWISHDLSSLEWICRRVHLQIK